MHSVKIIADTQFDALRATTFELSYPRYIHSEVMTHRVFSRNAASSRAIPIKAMIAQVRDNTVMPTWTANESGMQGRRITGGVTIHTLNSIWLDGANAAMATAELLEEAGAHKQNANRVLEPYQHIKVVLTATEFSNFFNLRFHKDAQPEIAELAESMYAHYVRSIPIVADSDRKSKLGWHLPYADGIVALADALMVSASCCAQVSYRKSDASIEKASVVYDRLVGGDPLHASPFEHQVTWGKKTESSRGNLHGLHQYRQDIEDNG